MAAQPSHTDGAATLDVAAGIARVMGDSALYARILARFHDDYRDGAATLRAAIASGDLRLANRIVHTLRGAAATIGAHVLHRQAGALELALRESACGHVAAAIGALASSLSEVLQAIGRRQAGEPAPHCPAAVPRPGQDVVAHLAALLDSGDGAAVDVLAASGASLKAALGEARFREVARAVGEFDFEGALKALGRDGAGGRPGGRLSG